MERIEACAYLHLLNPVDGIPGGEVYAALLKGGATVGEAVLDDEILGLLSIDEGSNVGVL